MISDVWNKVRDLRPEEFPAVLAELDSCGLFPAPEETLEQFRSRLDAMVQELEAIRDGSSDLRELIGQAPPVSGELRREADQLTWEKYRFRAGWIPAWYSTRQTGFFSVGILLEVDRRLPLLFLHGGFRRRKVRRGYGAAETMAHELVHAVRCAFPASAYEEFFPCRMSGSRFRRMVGNLFRRWYLPALLFGGIAAVPVLAAAELPGCAVPLLLPLAVVLRELVLARRLRRAERVLRRAGLEPLPVLLRLSDREIAGLAATPANEIPAAWQSTFRWRMFRERFSVTSLPDGQ